jgi:hypothetical protein
MRYQKNTMTTPQTPWLDANDGPFTPRIPKSDWIGSPKCISAGLFHPIGLVLILSPELVSVKVNLTSSDNCAHLGIHFGMVPVFACFYP